MVKQILFLTSLTQFYYGSHMLVMKVITFTTLFVSHRFEIFSSIFCFFQLR